MKSGRGFRSFRWAVASYHARRWTRHEGLDRGGVFRFGRRPPDIVSSLAMIQPIISCNHNHNIVRKHGRRKHITPIGRPELSFLETRMQTSSTPLRSINTWEHNSPYHYHQTPSQKCFSVTSVLSIRSSPLALL